MPRKTEINKGKIKDNALKALVKSNLFQPKIHKPKKGKGSCSRKGNKQSGFLISKKPDFLCLSEKSFLRHTVPSGYFHLK
ncbi:ribosome alternative rescue factor ArfA [Neisseria wadsworthii]|uniref:ribosome alternative rescue factor ArfA n=1 Tax=Neisseria wadsworthii TaxID=607711 RepID=UPI000D31115D|nr:ribosome alternative rescue factor ArfA [Neisseria wadsworthii]